MQQAIKRFLVAHSQMVHKKTDDNGVMQRDREENKRHRANATNLNT